MSSDPSPSRDARSSSVPPLERGADHAVPQLLSTCPSTHLVNGQSSPELARNPSPFSDISGISQIMSEIDNVWSEVRSPAANETDSTNSSAPTEVMSVDNNPSTSQRSVIVNNHNRHDDYHVTTNSGIVDLFAVTMKIENQIKQLLRYRRRIDRLIATAAAVCESDPLVATSTMRLNERSPDPNPNNIPAPNAAPSPQIRFLPVHATTHEGMLVLPEGRYYRYVGRLSFRYHHTTETHVLSQVIQITFPLSEKVPDYVQSAVSNVDKVHIKNVDDHMETDVPIIVRYIFAERFDLLLKRLKDSGGAQLSQTVALNFKHSQIRWLTGVKPAGLENHFYTDANIRVLSDPSFQ